MFFEACITSNLGVESCGSFFSLTVMASESSNQYLDQKSLFLNLGGLHTGGKRRHLTIQNNIERVYESVLSQDALGLEKIKQFH